MPYVCELISSDACEVADRDNHETVCQAIDRYRVATHWQELGYVKLNVECWELRLEDCITQIKNNKFIPIFQAVMSRLEGWNECRVFVDGKLDVEETCRNQMEFTSIELHKARMDYRIRREARDRFIDV